MQAPKHLNLDALHAFEVFADTLNFSTAAERLHISQPALHVKIRKLSEQLALPLYQRVGRRLLLTDYGQQLARYARELSSNTEVFVQSLYGKSSLRPVTVAAGDGAYLYLLGNALRQFIESAEAPPKLLTLDKDAALEAVYSGKAQLGIAPLDGKPADIVCQTLATIGQVLVVPRGHILAKRKTIRLRDLEGERLIVPPVGRPHRDMLARMLQSADVNWQAAVEASGWELMLNFVKMRAGIAVVNAYCRIPQGLVKITMPELPSLRFQLFHLKGQVQEGEALRLKNLLLEHVKEW